MIDAIQVLITTGSREEAERIARALVERKLAACAQISGPITSVYRWQGAVEQSEEWRCAVKTRGALFGRVEAAIRELHSYETPEIIAQNIDQGAAEYLAWLTIETDG